MIKCVHETLMCYLANRYSSVSTDTQNYDIVDVLMLHIYIIVSPSPRKANIGVNKYINRVELRET